MFLSNKKITGGISFIVFNSLKLLMDLADLATGRYRFFCSSLNSESDRASQMQTGVPHKRQRGLKKGRSGSSHRHEASLPLVR